MPDATSYRFLKEVSEQTNRFNSTEERVAFFKYLPKIELHAHLNGCIRESTLLELAKERNVILSPTIHDIQAHCHASENETESDNGATATTTSRVNHKRRSLTECFEIFGEIGQCITDLVALRRITREALEDFAMNGVAYLELRSTPKVLWVDASVSNYSTTSGQKKQKQKSTKREYVETILDVMKQFQKEEMATYLLNKNKDVARLPLVTRLIVSINRAEPKEYAMDHVNLAIQMKKEGHEDIVGLDLSGNPMKGKWKDFEAAFELARKAGLGTSIHCGEIPCEEDVSVADDDDKNDRPNPSLLKFALEDTADILSFRPDRLGHALLLTDDMYNALESDESEDGDRRIPIECCPTSNVMTLELSSHYQGDLVSGLRTHPRLQKWLDGNYPISFNTDDPGIFNTNSTEELILVAEAFCKTTKNDPCGEIAAIVMASIAHSFESHGFKDDLRRKIVQHLEARYGI